MPFLVAQQAPAPQFWTPVPLQEVRVEFQVVATEELRQLNVKLVGVLAALLKIPLNSMALHTVVLASVVKLFTPVAPFAAGSCMLT